MTALQATDGGGQAATPSALTRATQVALLLNAALHGIASLGFVVGYVPHAAGHPIMGRRAAAAGFAASFMLVFVARRLRRDAALLALPIAFVFCNLADSIYEFLVSGDPSDLGPAVFEAVFLSIYVFRAATHLRARNL